MMSTITMSGYVDDWGGGVLDLDAYMQRVGYSGPVNVDGPTLRALHRAHVATVPFENLDVILGRGISLDLADIQEKMVRQRRGGYCYESNLLFAAVLERIGFDVRRQLIRTLDPVITPRPRSHMTTFVKVDGVTWFADVGFGSGLLEPVELDNRRTFQQGAWEFRLTGPADDGGVRLQQRQPDAWTTLYTISCEPTYGVDVLVANENSSTSPGSPFTRRPIVVHRHSDHELRLIGRELTLMRPGCEEVTRVITETDYRVTLAEQFGIELSSNDTAKLAASIARNRPGEGRVR